jgi:hypothetical protein
LLCCFKRRVITSNSVNAKQEQNNQVKLEHCTTYIAVTAAIKAERLRTRGKLADYLRVFPLLQHSMLINVIV